MNESGTPEQQSPQAGKKGRSKRVETEILLEKINKSFGSVRALEEVTLCIEKGLTTAIVGDNGSGKSTLIKILSGNLRPDSGSITVGGRR